MTQENNIAILGYGIEGKATEAYLKKQGIKNLTILDEKDDPRAFADLSPYTKLFRSPGITLEKLNAPKEKITSHTRLFFEKCPCPIIGVTGTKGKGTTSTLIHLMLKNAGMDSHLGGNIGKPPLNFLDDLKPDSIVVLELSSFQLEDLAQSPNIAVVLNITSEHLDHHPSTEAYRKAKQSIVLHQKPEDKAIINGDYEGSQPFAQLGQGEKFYYSRHDRVEGAFIDGEQIMALGEPVASTTDIALRGAHNHENVLPACLAAKILKVPNETIQNTLREFTGLPHRLELAAEKNGIKFFDDSFSTTPETSIAGLQAFEEPLYLIAGGSEKHSDFTEWGQACAGSKNLKKILFIGLTAKRMEESLPEGVPFEHVQDLTGAFKLISKEAQPGDVVLLSPACASFDQFKNYKHRGEVFKEMAALF